MMRYYRQAAAHERSGRRHFSCVTAASARQRFAARAKEASMMRFLTQASAAIILQHTLPHTLIYPPLVSEKPAIDC